MYLDDTIVAIATPPGRGGIGVVRLSGTEARGIAAPMLRLAHDFDPGHARFGELIDPASGERIDEVHLFCKAAFLHRRRCGRNLLPRLAGSSSSCGGDGNGARSPPGGTG